MADIISQTEQIVHDEMSYSDLLCLAHTLRETIANLQTTIDLLNETIRQKDIEIKSHQEQINYLNTQLFGTRSEQTIYVDAAQGKLFPDKEDAETQVEAAMDTVATASPVHVSAHDRKAKRAQKDKYANLPTEQEIIRMSEEELNKYRAQGKVVIEIGIEHCRFEIRTEPSKTKRVDVCVQKYKIYDPKEDTEIFISADIPTPLIEHSFVSASLVSFIIANKYLAGLPLYRQEQIFRNQSFPVTRTAMANWVITVSQNPLEKLYLRLCRLIIEGKVIHADETTIQVLKEQGRRPQQRSYMWVYSTAKRSDRQIRCFVYENSRSGECAHNFLRDFIGILISDGYGGYFKVEVIRAGCWAHMRRKWVEAIPKGVSSENSNAETGLAYCNMLFAFERTTEMLSDEERLLARNKTTDGKEPKSAREILKNYWQWVDSFDEKEVSGKLKKAIVYAKNQKQYLNTFLEHGEIEISNNQAENAIRPFVIGRKNWLFSDTEKGAHASAIIYSLFETAKANNLNPYKWMEYLLTVLPERFAYDPKDNIDDLLPWSDKMQTSFKMK